MIAAHNVLVDQRVFDPGTVLLPDKKIIDSPSRVVFARAETVAPPAVCAGNVGISVAKRIDEARVQKRAERSALLVGESGVPAVRTGVFEVDLPMRNVQIAAVDYRTFFRKPEKIRPDRVFPFQTERKTPELVLCIRGIRGYKRESGVFQRDCSPFRIKSQVADPVKDIVRFPLCKNSGSGIAFLFRAEKERPISIRTIVKLIRLQFRFLQRQNIG